MTIRIAAALVLAAVSAAAAAITPTELQTSLAAEARQADPAFREFSAQRGETFYRARHGGDWSCSTCHTDNPAAAGSHAVTNKVVKPLAPAANPERFSNPDKIEKWFKRNCNDVLKRVCTPQEKGDLLVWLLTVKR
jgi:mono/diheme cytochrome c family protein